MKKSSWFKDYLRDWRFTVDAWFQSWMHQRYIRMQVEATRAREISERQWRLDAERDVEALNKTVESLKASLHEPFPEAKRLLAVINDIISPCPGEPVNQYELRCWKVDYIDFLRRNGEFIPRTL
jgi:hypothetical protein